MAEESWRCLFPIKPLARDVTLRWTVGRDGSADENVVGVLPSSAVRMIRGVCGSKYSEMDWPGRLERSSGDPTNSCKLLSNAAGRLMSNADEGRCISTGLASCVVVPLVGWLCGEAIPCLYKGHLVLSYIVVSEQ